MKLLHRKSNGPPRRERPGSLGSAPVYSYYARRSQEQSVIGRQVFRDVVNKENVARAARFGRRRFGLVVVLIVGVVAAANILWLSPDVKVVPADSHDTFLRSLASYQQTADTLFGGSALNRTKFTADVSGIISGLKQQYPDLSTVNVALPLIGHRPVVYITPTTPQLLLTTTSGHSYVVDENGRALSEIQGSNPSLTLVQDESGAAVDVGQLALPGDTVTFIRTVQYEVQQKGLRVAHFVLPAGKSELDLYTTGVAYYVKFNLADDTAQAQAGSFLVVRHYLLGKGKTPTAYIDVRIVGRAYYK